MKVYIIILNYNGKQDTLDCLTSLKQQTYAHFDTVVVDNGSSDNSCAAIKEKHPDITLIPTGENLGFAGGNNVGIEHCLKHDCDAIFLLNNDTEIDPRCVEEFVLQSKTMPKSILGGCLTQFHDRTKYDHIGGMWSDEKANFDLIGSNETITPTKYQEPRHFDFVCGASMFIPRRVFEEIGLLEPKFFLIWEESDYCAKALRNQFEVTYCPKAIIYHKVSASFVGGKPHTHYFWWRNRLFYMKRNLSNKKYQALMIKIIVPELAHILKLYLLKSIQLLFIKQKREEKAKKVKCYKAALRGALDYFRGHFGPAPDWIIKK
ncbi:MAG: glycosyltransferase family 2 protein [Rhabdochlamydiaceae bacterium]|nr:glycosyltransferase family 2 protein [Candidatus Amphrikana amoebophyrae]